MVGEKAVDDIWRAGMLLAGLVPAAGYAETDRYQESGCCETCYYVSPSVNFGTS